jgi:PAS domain S-box-containing protein
MAESLTAAELPLDSLRKLIDGASRHAFIGLSASGRISFWSRGAERLFGWADAEVLGQSVAILFTEEDRVAEVPKRNFAQAYSCECVEDVRRHVRKDGTQFWAHSTMTALGDGSGYVKVLRDWTETQQADEANVHQMKRLQLSQQALVAELQHRTRNLLALVRSIATRTLESGGSLQDFGRQFDGRLAALGRAQSRLTRSDEPFTLGDIVKAELDAHGAMPGNGRVLVAGPPIALSGSTVQTLTLAIHELALNALQYGALAVDCGRLAVTWTVEKGSAGAAARLRLSWRESGLPLGADFRPVRSGFGRELIEQVLAYDLVALSRFEFTAEGLHCSIEIPISEYSLGEQGA